jgi:8-oxo-dGTP diphosphatase
MSDTDLSPSPRTEIAVAVVEHEGRFLVGLRERGAPLAGYWEFPGGKLRERETPEAAAVRECLEETGLLVRVVGRYASTDHDYEHARVRLHFFACQGVEPQSPLRGRFRWASTAELGRLTFPPANAELLSQLTAGKTASPIPSPLAGERREANAQRRGRAG